MSTGRPHAPPRLVGGSLTAMGLALAVVLVLGQLGLVAAGADPPERVTICHRTHSVGNPYVMITVAVSAVDGQGGGDHFGQHTGPVFDPATMQQGDTWGDIIPPIAGVHGGLNWGAGQAILEAGCVVTVRTTTATTTTATTTTPGTTTPGTTTTPTSTETTTTATTATQTGTTATETTTTPGTTTTATTTGGETTTQTTTIGALAVGANIGRGSDEVGFSDGTLVAIGAIAALMLMLGTGLLRFGRPRNER